MKYPITYCLLFFAASVFAQAPSADNLIPRSLLFKEKTRQNVRLALDGNTVFYQKTPQAPTARSTTCKRHFP